MTNTSKSCCCCPTVPQVHQVSTSLTFSDHLGSFKARWGIGRLNYVVAPGLYSVGKPDSDSPVLVTANYKMSFDRLRSQLDGRDLWILVLDTKGINVWCAAGKGTFGTEELIGRLKSVQMDKVISHKTLILPQLGAPGIAAHKVREASGFRVVYGPVRAEDVPEYLDKGQRATAAMRRVEFPFFQRLVLVPMELVMWAKYAIFIAMFLFLFSGFSSSGYSTSLTFSTGTESMLVLLIAYMTGGVLGPLLLPWLPGKSFSVKGLWVGLVVSFCFLSYWRTIGRSDSLTQAAWMLIIPVLTSFMVMNFTGASTYTSLSGVRREMKFAVPLQVIAAVCGLALWVSGRFLQ